MYTVCEPSSLLERAGWKVIRAYENIETLEPFTHKAIFKGNRSMNIVAKASKRVMQKEVSIHHRWMI